MRPQPESLLYGLEESPPFRLRWLYSAQWMSYALGIVLVTVALISTGMGLGEAESIAFGSRVLIVTGLATLLQAYLGHGYPIIEAPAVIFWALYLFTFEHASSPEEALSNITGGMLVAGTTIVLFAATGLIRRSARLFTPALAGTVILLISLSFLAGSDRHLFGVTADRPAGDPAHLVGVLLVVLAGALISLTGRGLSRTIPIFLTTVVAYLAYLILGRIDLAPVARAPMVALPTPFAWGAPSFSLSIALSYAVTGILGTLNTFAAIEGVADVYGHEDVEDRHGRGVLVNGLAQLLVAVGGAAGSSSHTTSSVIIRMSRVGARSAIALAALILLALGFVPAFSALLTTVPLAIADGIFYLIVAGLFSVGLDQYRRLEFDARTRLVIGIPIVAALSVTYAPAAVFEAIPHGGALLVRNPVIVGAVLGIVCEQVLFASWARRTARLRSRLRLFGFGQGVEQLSGRSAEKTRKMRGGGK